MQYPNLELLELVAKLYLKKMLQQKGKETKRNFNFHADVFPQEWGTTSLGFDEDRRGQPTWGGSAITPAYTTVFKETQENIYLVFFGGEICYAVSEPSDQFYNDLKEHRLAPLSQANLLY